MAKVACCTGIRRRRARPSARMPNTRAGSASSGTRLSRPFRALDLWLLLKYAGARRLAQAIERNIACAKHLEKLARASADFEMLAPVELSIFCFRHAPPGFAGDLDALNERILVDLQRGGGS